MIRLVGFPKSSRAIAGLMLVIALGSLIWLRVGGKPVLHAAAKRKAAHQTLTLDEYRAVGRRGAARAGVVAGVAGLATFRWWGRDQQPLAIDRKKAVPPPLGRREAMWFWGGIGCAVMLGAVYRAPRLGRSF